MNKYAHIFVSSNNLHKAHSLLPNEFIDAGFDPDENSHYLYAMEKTLLDAGIKNQVFMKSGSPDDEIVFGSVE